MEEARRGAEAMARDEAPNCAQRFDWQGELRHASPGGAQASRDAAALDGASALAAGRLAAGVVSELKLVHYVRVVHALLQATDQVHSQQQGGHQGQSLQLQCGGVCPVSGVRVQPLPLRARPVQNRRRQLPFV